MKKKLYFTNNANPLKQANSINTYVNFVYDTKTGELKLVDCFNGEKKEVVVATIDKAAPADPEVTTTATTTTDAEGNEVAATLVTATFAEDAVTKEYSLDGTNFQEYPEEGITVTEAGTITFRSTDEAGNTSTFTQEVTVG